MTSPDGVQPDELRREVAERLAAAGVPSPEADARWLVEHASRGCADGCDRAELARLVERRAGREPLQLVLGHTWFRELRLTCRPGVFIPRPETEIVAGAAITAARDAVVGRGRAVVVEPCTGTGAIALSIGAEVPHARVLAADRSEAAVALARENLAAVVVGDAGVPGLARGAAVEVVAGELLEPVPDELRGAVDVLVANPPYLPAADRRWLPPEVRDHDPDDALVAGPAGTEIVDALLAAAAGWLRPGGTVVLEIDARHGAEALEAARRAELSGPRLLRDLTGVDRAVVAHRPHDRTATSEDLR